MELFNKIKVPTNADAYNLTADLRALGESVNAVIPVSSLEERNALPAYEDMVVIRLDRRFAPLEKYQNGGWSNDYTVWTTLPLATGYASQGPLFTPRVSRVGQTVFLEGAVKKTSGALPGGLAQITQTGWTLPDWALPGNEIYGVGAIDQVANISRIRVTKSGEVYAGGADGANYAFLTLTYRAGDMGALA